MFRRDEREEQQADNASSHSGGTPPPIFMATPNTSPALISPDKRPTIGSQNEVFCHYPREEGSKKKKIKVEEVAVKTEDEDVPPLDTGTVVALHGHHIDPNRWPDATKKIVFYGATVDWDEERFGVYKKNYVQVKINGNGDYVVNEIDNTDAKNIIFEIIVDRDEVEVILNSGQKSYEVFGDDYGLNPMRWFETNENGVHSLKEEHEHEQCKKCRDPWCIILNDNTKVVENVCKSVEDAYADRSAKEKRFMAYRKVARKRYGVLPVGVRRKLGICCERYIRSKFPKKDNETFTEFERGSYG